MSVEILMKFKFRKLATMHVFIVQNTDVFTKYQLLFLKLYGSLNFETW